jgi:predicted lipid-binding transport protein (Tim44 family)
MNSVFDIYTIIFLVLAVFIFARLRSVLGQRTGRERPPYDPYSARDAAKPVAGPDKVVTLPGRATEKVEPRTIEAKPAAERWAGIAPADSSVAKGLDAIVATDSSFDAAHFVSGAKAAYEMIVLAFAQGDRKSLKNLLARDVYDGFAAAITEREGRGEIMESRFVSISKAEITAAEVKSDTAQMTVRFVSELISATRNKAGEVVDGSPERVSEVTDIWTFARELGSSDPNWKLIATEAG